MGFEVLQDGEDGDYTSDEYVTRMRTTLGRVTETNCTLIKQVSPAEEDEEEDCDGNLSCTESRISLVPTDDGVLQQSLGGIRDLSVIRSHWVSNATCRVERLAQQRDRAVRLCEMVEKQILDSLENRFNQQ